MLKKKKWLAVQFILNCVNQWRAGVGWRGLGCETPPPRNSEGPPKSRQTQPDCENC
jgi:hypothetical protein